MPDEDRIDAIMQRLHAERDKITDEEWSDEKIKRAVDHALRLCINRLYEQLPYEVRN